MTTGANANWRERIGATQLRIWKRILLAIALLTLVSWWVHRPDERTRHLNDVLDTSASRHLKNYPYEFRVLRVEGKTAIMSTPRNFDVPAFKMLGALYPNIDYKGFPTKVKGEVADGFSLPFSRSAQRFANVDVGCCVPLNLARRAHIGCSGVAALGSQELRKMEKQGSRRRYYKRSLMLLSRSRP